MPEVNSYSFGRIVVDGRTYTSDIILFWDGRIESWWRKEGHHVCLEDIKTILEAKPDIVIFGTGKYGVMKVGDGVKRELEKLGIKYVAEKSDNAVKTFNSAKGKKVLAIHLTC